MFGLLKMGFKLGIGCILAGILALALIAGGIYWHFSGRQQKSTPRKKPKAALFLPDHVDLDF